MLDVHAGEPGTLPFVSPAVPQMARPEACLGSVDSARRANFNEFLGCSTSIKWLRCIQVTL